jgi:hypothetical protein
MDPLQAFDIEPQVTAVASDDIDDTTNHTHLVSNGLPVGSARRIRPGQE